MSALYYAGIIFVMRVYGYNIFYMLNGNLNMVSRHTIGKLVCKDPNQWLALKVI